MQRRRVDPSRSGQHGWERRRRCLAGRRHGPPDGWRHRRCRFWGAATDGTDGRGRWRRLGGASDGPRQHRLGVACDGPRRRRLWVAADGPARRGLLERYVRCGGCRWLHADDGAADGLVGCAAHGAADVGDDGAAAAPAAVWPAANGAAGIAAAGSGLWAAAHGLWAAAGPGLWAAAHGPLRLRHAAHGPRLRPGRRGARRLPASGRLRHAGPGLRCPVRRHGHGHGHVRRRRGQLLGRMGRGSGRRWLEQSNPLVSEPCPRFAP
mmetsp:Transcript_40701/g.103596  ORF Transcript_40701/g.103596 Transcript_40701/m.103596 type:complete len:265 (+) Transcript_40701:182-976(+)